MAVNRFGGGTVTVPKAEPSDGTVARILFAMVLGSVAAMPETYQGAAVFGIIFGCVLSVDLVSKPAAKCDTVPSDLRRVIPGRFSLDTFRQPCYCGAARDYFSAALVAKQSDLIC